MRLPRAVAVILLLCLHGASQQQPASVDPKHLMVIQELFINGVQTLSSAQLDDIVHSLTALRMNQDGAELKERLRDAFQQRGYFDASVNSVEIKPLDALARPMPVLVEADVSEGPRYTLSAFKFLNNHAISTETLQASFSIHPGDYFDTDKVRFGLEKLASLYRSKGFLQETAVPNADERSGNAVTLTVDVNEGMQYHMGKLEIAAPKELAEKLQTLWKLQPGKPFDQSYLATFAEKNSSLLPPGFTVRSGFNVALNCADQTASVQIQVDPQHPLAIVADKLGCGDDQDLNKPVK